MYFIQKNLTRFNNLGYTDFLNPNELNLLKSKIKKGSYSIFYPYKDSEKNIVYKNEEPMVLLYEIKTKHALRHQDILGTIYSLNIAPDLFGDIIITNNRYYIYILPIVQNYFESNFIKVKNTNVELELIDINVLKDYTRSYEKLELIVSSIRIDTVISAICNTARSNISNLIKRKEILLNYDYLTNTDYKLKENDVFSIKRIGKFKYIRSLKKTKKDKDIIEIYKYI